MIGQEQEKGQFYNERQRITVSNILHKGINARGMNNIIIFIYKIHENYLQGWLQGLIKK